jgi:dTDP-glucose 4,6-dehydratase
MKKTIFVTGGLGFIGSNLVNLLISKNFFVVNIDKVSYSSNFDNIKNVKKNYKFFKLDINNQTKIKKLLLKYKPLCIFNLAAESHVDRSIDNPWPFINSNILGTFNLLEAIRFFLKKIKGRKFRFIHISTDEVYGDIKKGKFSLEEDSYNPSSPYSSSKASSDLLVKSYIRTYKLPAIITNCCNNYGPNQYPEKLIPRMILCIQDNKNLPIYGKGKNEREWIHVHDHCLALLKIYQKGKIGENYNVGTGVIFKNIDIANNIIQISKKFISNSSKIIFVKDRPGHDKRYALNSNKIRKKLNWRPMYDFKKGIEKTINWYFKNQAWTKKLRSKNYAKRIGMAS